MRIHRLFVSMLLVSASLTAVACGSGSNDMSGSAIDEPVEPGGGVVPPAGGEQPGVKPGGGGIVPPGGSGSVPGGSGSTGSTGFESPADYLNSLNQTQRVDLADIEDAGSSPVYTANFDNFVAALKDVCPEKASCSDPVASLLYNTRSASMKSSGVYPATYPQAKDVLAAYEAAEVGGEPATGGVDVQQVAEDTAAKLSAAAGDGVVWEDVSAIIVEVAGGGADAQATADSILIAMKDASPSIEHYDTMQALVNGDKVAPADAAAAIEAIVAAMEG